MECTNYGISGGSTNFGNKRTFRRRFICQIAVLAACLALAASSALATDPFMIVALPDTQFYSANLNGGTTAMFTAQTQWIANNRASSNIAFVTHVGDVVNTATNAAEWTNALAAMNILGTPGSSSIVPYSVSPGNHDMGDGGANFLDDFGPARYSGNGWYGGSDATNLSTFQRFSAGGYNFLHISLQVDSSANTPAAALTWAQSVINSNPGLMTIVSTHNNMNVAARSTNGNTIWNNFVTNNSQIFMVLSGHYHGANQQISTGNGGNKVIEMLSDYQDGTNGGNGFMRQITFNPDAGQIQVRSYSPSLGQNYTDLRNQFAYNVTFGGNNTITVNGLAPPPPPVLKGWWQLNETSGTTVSDSSGGWSPGWYAPAPAPVLNHGVLVGANAQMVAGAGRDGSAALRLQPAATGTAYAKLTGTSGVNTGNAATNLGEQTFTLAAWIKRTGAGYAATSGTGGVTNVVPIVAKGVGEADSSNNKDANFIFGIDLSTNRLCADFETYSATTPANPNGGSGTNFPITGNTAVPVDANVWHHVAVTWDGSAWTLYLDGAFDGSKSWSFTSPNAPAFPRYDSIQQAAIGAAVSSTGGVTGNFYGFVDDVRIYQGAMNLSAIQAIMVPEPATWGFVLSAATALLAWRRSRQRQS